MIDAKSFMEFFEKECNVKFVDHKTGKSVLDIIAERDKRKNPYNESANKSDYDKFLEAGDDGKG